MESANQILVKLLEGNTRCLLLPSPAISGEDLKLRLYPLTGLPPRLQLLVAGAKVIHDETLIHASPDGSFPSCSLLLRLRGGKGGFGSLLRGAATKAGQKKTNNFDACRDLSGRRLRHVNAEKRLEEWKADAEGRKLEKIAEEFLKKKTKDVKNRKEVDRCVESYRELSEKCMAEVEAAVKDSFALIQEKKRKALDSAGNKSKQLKLWLGKSKIDDSDSEDGSDTTDGKSMVADDSNLKDSADSSGSVSVGSDGESSAGSSERSNLDEENGHGVANGLELQQGSAGGPSNVDLNNSAEARMVFFHGDYSMDRSVSESGKSCDDLDVFTCDGVAACEMPEEHADANNCSRSVNYEVHCPDTVNFREPLNLDNFNSASELETLGMERLKGELQSHGLKCGGTLQERAARLYLLKTTPLDKLPKKVLARPMK